MQNNARSLPSGLSISQKGARAVANPFAQFLKDHQVDINPCMEAYFCGRTDRADLDTFLYAPLRAFSANAGKRHRPLICMLACQAVGGTFTDALAPAAAIEHFQSAALIHDDIADHGELRRGEPCMHRTQGIGIATNCGDLELTTVTSIILADDFLSANLKVRLLGELTAMTERTIEGQALDLGWVRDDRFDISVEDYLAMATLKTAYYSEATPLACGAIVGGGSEEQVEALRGFGMKTGLAFQIQDDLLNLIGKAEANNKDFRSDITEGKRTLVVVHALQNAAPEARERLVEILSSKERDPEVLAEAVAIMEETGSIDYARTFAEDLTLNAKARLAGALPPSQYRDLLVSMADWFVNRLK